MSEKKSLKISLILLITIAMLLLVLTAPAWAKSKAKLSKSKLTLKAGKTYTLKLKGYKGKAKWYVKGKKLVTIKTKGKKKHKAVIKAKSKAGTCYIKVKAGKKILKCKVTVKKVKRSSSPSEPDFKEKPLSGTAKDHTASFARTLPTKLQADDTFTKAYLDTSFKMLSFLNADESAKGKNILISPDSILTCLAMTELGASGDTLNEMKTAFGGIDPDLYYRYLYTLNSRITGFKNIRYNIADSVWYRQGAIRVKESFLQDNVNYFNSEIYEAPFNDVTVSDMNNWVYNKTRGMIPSIIDRLYEDTRLTLINAIAFEGQWAEPYNSTVSGTFKKEDGTQETAKLLKGVESTYVEINGAPGFVKSYSCYGQKGGIAFMGIETPEGKTVDQFISELSSDAFTSAYRDKLTTTSGKTVSVTTKMPEFKYDYDTKLVNTMRELGMKLAFTESADFSSLTDDQIMIDDIIHKTHIELDKNGTKAAAATAVTAKAGSVPSQNVIRKSVDLTHPFVYAIIDTETGLPLFIGAVKTVK